ncbi:MAG: response regulator [Lachnospiraceae bacterium]|nr:response regulator [Lachnospiraceae bacterium]
MGVRYLIKNSTDYDDFLNENRKRINEQLNVVMRVCVLAGPMIAVAVRFKVFVDVNYFTAAFVSVFMLILTVMHKILLKKYATSLLTSIIALIAIDILLVVMNRAHLSIYINWFLIPLLSLQFCDFKLYTITVIINYGFMVFSTWELAPWFAERRNDIDTPFAYFASRIGGLTIEMAVMIFAGYVLCKMITGYYRSLIEKAGELNSSHETLERLNGELSSIANIYYSAHDIDIKNDTFFEIRMSYEGIKEIIGDSNNNAKEMLNNAMIEMSAPAFKDEILKFIDFDTLEERLKDELTITLEFKSNSGEWRKGRFVVSERADDGSLSHVIWLVENIDFERKQRDALIDMSQRAIAASEAKSSFLSNMSHEIRTPINAVLGMNEMILRECEDNNVIAYSQSIRTAGNTLLGLVNDILDFSKIEAGKMEIFPVDYDMSSVINDLVNMIQTRADEKGLVLSLDFDKDIPKSLHGDEVRIKQIITNILSNAVKYTEKGSIVFGMSYERDEQDENSVYLNVYVKDTGIGIKPDDMEKLFSEFERIEEDRNRHVEGTGLGMNITKTLLEMMGSSLKVESVYGLGSRFYFTLKQRVVKWEPLGDYETSYKDSLKGHRRYKEKFTAPSADVLVVDDNQMNLMVFSSLLNQTKVRIDMALSGDEGLSFAYDKKYDIIFLDHMMPEKDGIETLREMKAQRGNPNINTPVICLTANAISGAREEYISEGFDDYLTKPIEPSKLEDMLIMYISEEKIIRSDIDDEVYEVSDNDDNELPEFVKNISEIDVDTGITNNGNVAAYIETMKVYAKMSDEYTDEIEGLMRAGDIKNATIKIHALKSTSRIIGALDIGELAQKLENAGKANDIDTLNAELEILLTRARNVGELLKPLLVEQRGRDEGLSLISNEMLADAYEKIKGYAMDCDNASIEDVLDELSGYKIPDDEKERYEAIVEASDNFDFDGIASLL